MLHGASLGALNSTCHLLNSTSVLSEHFLALQVPKSCDSGVQQISVVLSCVVSVLLGFSKWVEGFVNGLCVVGCSFNANFAHK